VLTISLAAYQRAIGPFGQLSVEELIYLVAHYCFVFDDSQMASTSRSRMATRSSKRATGSSRQTHLQDRTLLMIDALFLLKAPGLVL
jgi:hypothetical protein